MGDWKALYLNLDASHLPYSWLQPSSSQDSGLADWSFQQNILSTFFLLDHFDYLPRVHRYRGPCPLLCVPSFLLTIWLRTVYIYEMHFHVSWQVYPVLSIFTSCTFMSLDEFTPYHLLSGVGQLSWLHTLSGQARRIYDHLATSLFTL